MRTGNAFSGWMIASLLVLVTACASGPCRQVRNPDMANAAGGPQPQDQAQGTTESAPTAAALGANNVGRAAPVPSAPTQANKSVRPNQGGAVSGSESNAREATVLVYKPDGSLQCGMGKAVPVEQMEKELAGIRVFSRQNRSDGMMHIQVCGSPTGMINVYEIPASSLKTAEARGFKKFEAR